jgi:hypothetical protein
MWNGNFLGVRRSGFHLPPQLKQVSDTAAYHLFSSYSISVHIQGVTGGKLNILRSHRFGHSKHVSYSERGA